MKSEWKKVKLDDIVRFQQGKQVELEDQVTEQTDGFIRFVRIIDYTNKSEPPRYIKANTKWSSYVTEDDVVMIRYGSQTAGKVVIGKAGIIANNMFRVIPIIEDIHRKYLYYFLKSSKVYLYLRGGQGSSTMPAITFGLMSSVDVLLPPLPTQKKIAHILSTLDDKIELNRKMNETLEAMAQALFKSWFVDFDPVHAKANAKSDVELEKAAAELGISKEVLELFPSAFVESEMGMIPEGWEVKRFGDIVTPKKGKNITKKKVTEGDVPVVAGGLTPAYFHNQYNVEAPVITVSASGANAGYVHLYNINIWASDCSYINATNSNYIYTHYTYLKFKQNKITWMQQGAAQPHIYPSHLMRLDFIDCGSKLWSYFEDMISPMFNRLASNEREVQTLQKTRDTLLPKLLSGELDVSEVEI